MLKNDEFNLADDENNLFIRINEYFMDKSLKTIRYWK